MNKVLNALKFVWKNNKLWLFVSVITMVILFTATMVATQQKDIAGTINTVMGGPREVLVKGDPTPYMRYKADNKDFKQFETNSEFRVTRDKQDSLSAAKELNELIVEEGIVLLKNEQKALPLSKSAKVSVFGKNSVNLVLGGSGSSAGSDGGATVLYDSLKNAGFTVNPTLRAFYENNNASASGRGKNPQMGTIPAGLATGETPQSKYTESVKSSYAEYKDAAIVVISRIGGEGFDLPRSMKTSFKAGAGKVAGAKSPNDHYLQLDANERDLLDAACEAFGKVVVLINASTSMELGFLENDKIAAALWIGSPGSAVNAIGRVLNGEVNPSGRLFDTFARDFTLDPTYANFANNNKTDGNRYVGTDSYFVEYEEGIYVGYRYYETRAYEEAQEDNPDWWKSNVVYPFGYGLSYTNFEWEITDARSNNGGSGSAIDKDDVIEVDVKVTNKGSVSGKEVVQLYFSAPYYGEIEKAHVVLGDFAKTKEIAPGASDTVTLSLAAFDMASYDYNNANNELTGFKGYKLEDGIYNIFIGRNAHDAWAAGEDELLSVFFVVRDNDPDDERVTYFIYDKDPATGYEVKNRFDDVSGYIKKYMSRLDFEGTFPEPPTDAERAMSKEFINSLYFFGMDGESPVKKPSEAFDKNKPWHSGTTYKQGESGTAKLHQVIGQDGTVDYNDPLWDDILNQITISEMAELIGIGNFNTRQIVGIGKPRTTDPDSPSGFVNFMGDPSVYNTCFYASGCVIAATFNKDLAYDFGVMVGIEGIIGNVKGDGRPYSGWYAPAVNIHRSPFSGRNFEYYSEDGFLSGIIAANTVLGARAKGVYAYIKHFAVNDQETNRDSNGILVWLDEQSMREIYLKPFEIVVKKGKAIGVMSSFNRLGTVWAGGSYELLTEVLRNEWGFKGTVITDYNLQEYMPADQMIRAGGDLNLTQISGLPSTSAADLTTTQIAAMRQATKNILYTVAQSNAMNGKGEGVEYRYALPLWNIWLILLNIGALLAFAAWGFFAIRKAQKKQGK